MQPRGGLLFNFFRSLFLIGFILCSFIFQSFIPVYSLTPACSGTTGTTAACPSGYIPACTTGYSGIARCQRVNGFFTPGCQTAYAFYSGAAICKPSSNSSGLSCSTNSNCPLGTCPNGSTYQKYTCTNGQCILINYFVDPCLMSSSSSSSSGGNNCKCPTGQWWDGSSCKPGADQIVCPAVFDPVCGCDGMTYGNSCEAARAGIKSFTNGACQTSSSGGSGISCLGNTVICANGNTPTCSMGFVGSAVCKYGGPGCLTSTAFYTNAVQCVNSTTSSSSSSGCTIPCGNICCRAGQQCIYPPCPLGSVNCNPYCSTSSSSSSSSSGGGNSCKCPDGLRYDNVSMQCVNGLIPCPLVYLPVCGCNGMTYGNACEAYNAGVKSFTNGACQTSSSGGSGISCLGNTVICANGNTPTCSMGFVGMAVCKYGAPGCLTSTAFYTNAVQCVNSTTSSSSSSSSSSGGGDSCKCPQGLRYDSVSMQCVSGIVLCELCGGSTDKYVCGCDRKTYCNSCEAYKAGVKTFTAGPCQTSSSGGGAVTCSGNTAVCLSGGTPVCSMGFVGMAVCKYGGPGCLTSTAFYTNAVQCSPILQAQKKQSLASCLDGHVMCDSGVAFCLGGLVPDCGSNYGLTSEFAGQGCASPSKDLFSPGTVSCTSSEKSLSLANQVSSCENSNNLCPASRKRFEGCREDKTSCKCVCQFKTRNEKTTPRCNNNQPACSNNSIPECSNPNNFVICLDGKLLCHDKDADVIDFSDIVSCKKK